MTQTGDSFGRDVCLTATDIAAFARMCGDANPLHHDPDHARRSRFGGLIASGPHTSALMMGAVASHFCARGEMVGLEFRFRFRRVVKPDVPMRIHWQVVSVRPGSKGTIAFLAGALRDDQGAENVRSVAKVLLLDGQTEPGPS